jgi:L-2,4-diaminobutyrate decarboxylase
VVVGQTVHQGRTCLKFTLLNPTLTHEKLDGLLELIKELGGQLQIAP